MAALVRKLLLSESTARSTFLVESSGSARKLLLLMTVRVVVGSGSGSDALSGRCCDFSSDLQ